jgi:hypothetical protein
MTDHSGRTHSVYGASSSNRWMKCYGSIQRAAGMPEGLASSYALDGEEAHELLEYALLHQFHSAREAKIQAGLEWEHRHDDEEIRLESVQDALDHVQDLIDAYAPDIHVYLETQFRFPTTHNDDAGGTSDVTIFVPDLDMMIVADYKHGSGVAVNVQENTQLLFYCVGSRQALREQGMCNSGRTIYRMMIMQPRGFHRDGKMREWICNDERLDQFIGEVNFAIEKTRERVPEIRPGSYCRWCPAISACPEAEQHRMRSVLPTYNETKDIKDGLPPVNSLSVDRIADILTMRDMVEEWFEAVHRQAIALARAGANIPGKKLVFSQARSKWNGDPREIAGNLGQIAGIPGNVFIQPKLVTITEARALVKSAIYERVGQRNSKKLIEEANKAMAPLMIRDTSGNLTLVDYDDKRPAVNIATMIEYKEPGK